MSILDSITRFVKDPPPSYVFEVSEQGMAYARPSGSGRLPDEVGFVPFEPGTLVASPVEDNVKQPDLMASLIARMAPQADARKPKRRRPAAVILPDYAARVTVLDFDSFPPSPEERLSLIRFRLKKTIPFDVDSAAVSYFVQPSREKGKIDVVAVAVALEVIARYEALFRSADLHPGEITTSSLAALNLYRDQDGAGAGVGVVAKLSGHVLTAMVVAQGVLKLFRCVELEQATLEEVLAVLHPTLAYVEDELSSPASRVVVCGFPPNQLSGLRCPVEPMRSQHGAPGAANGGLLGYLEGALN